MGSDCPQVHWVAVGSHLTLCLDRNCEHVKGFRENLGDAGRPGCACCNQRHRSIPPVSLERRALTWAQSSPPAWRPEAPPSRSGLAWPARQPFLPLVLEPQALVP